MPAKHATISDTSAAGFQVGTLLQKKQRRPAAASQKKVTAERHNKISEGSTARIVQLLDFDTEMVSKWLRQPEALLIGTDEVGRGCLAGPVVAAAVQIPDLSSQSDLATLLSRLNDSKKLSPRRRQELAAVLQKNCRYAVGEACVEEIERINILQASFLAMTRAIAQLQLPDSSVVLVDGNKKICGLSLRQIVVVGGDGISASIAAASVIAKVYRDGLMCNLYEEFPQYRWNSNKGYGSKDHCQAILTHGLTPWHRPSFCTRLCQSKLL
jgi:ribonuclease HII